MLDRHARRVLEPITRSWASVAVRAGVSADAMTGVGLLVGIAAAAAAATSQWGLALVLWLLGRIPDGLDGPMARQQGGGSERGGFLDIMADFTVYGAFVAGCAIGRPDARVALIVLVLTYYVNGAAFLAFSSAVERIGRRTGLEDERSFVFPRGLAEGTETIVAHSLLVAFPEAMEGIAWGFAALVAITAGQRIRLAVRVLRDPATPHRGTST